MFTHDFRYRSRVNTMFFPYGAPIPFHVHHAVGIMPVEVGLHQVIGDNSGVIGTTAHGGEEFVTNAAQSVGGDGRHKRLLSASGES